MNALHEQPTLRDRFAVAAIPALIERDQIAAQAGLAGDCESLPEDTRAGWNEPDAWKNIAAAAYALADAMIDQRRQTRQGLPT